MRRDAMLLRESWTKPARLTAVGALVMSAALAAGPATIAQSPAASDGTGCQAGGTADPVQLPDIEEGKFNVAMVLIGPHSDGGWSQAHYEGLLYARRGAAILVIIAGLTTKKTDCVC